MFQRITPVVLNIIIINVLVFLFIQFNFEQINICATGWNEYFLLYKSGLIFSADNGCGSFQPIQLVSSMFSHMDLMHLFFNMFTLFSLGTAVEMVMKRSNFIALYLFSGLFGTTLTWLLDPSPSPVLGASGALFGVLAGFAYYYPTAKLQLFLIPYGIRAKRLVTGAAVISLGLMTWNLIFPQQSILGGISHFGHMAGLAGGLLYLYRWKILSVFKGGR